MIHSFTCSNFYSFDDTVGVSFRVDNKSPDNHSYIRTPSGAKLSLVEAVIGPNASGKTNLLKVLPMLRWLIVDSFDLNPSSLLPVKPFVPHQEKGVPTKLSVVFEVDKDIFEYEVHLTQQRIQFESLMRRNKSSQRLTNKTLLKREYNNRTKSYSLELKGFLAPAGFPKVLRQNATAISTAVRLNHELSVQISSYWQKVDFNVMESGWMGDQIFGDQLGTQGALQFYHFNQELRIRAEEMLAKFDLGFAAFEFEEQPNGQVSFKILHNFGKEQFSLPVDYESSGTKQLFIILKTILMALSNGGIAVLDEFDAKLHPEMVEELIGLFTDRTTNPNSAQILFTTHSHKILSKLDKYQIVLTEKSREGHTDAWRLDDMKGVRSDDNYFSKYMAGAYGGVPNFD
jgi:predicted ATPase